MSDKVFHFPGEKISVQYAAKRCIHTAECARNLPAVFDPQRKPWVDPNAATAEAVAAAVECCPTSALHFTRHDGDQAEAVPEQNRITIGANGPLWLRGNLGIIGPDGTVTLKDTRLALARSIGLALLPSRRSAAPTDCRVKRGGTGMEGFP